MTGGNSEAGDCCQFGCGLDAFRNEYRSELLGKRGQRLTKVMPGRVAIDAGDKVAV
jgi:hypothetical protein